MLYVPKNIISIDGSKYIRKSAYVCDKGILPFKNERNTIYVGNLHETKMLTISFQYNKRYKGYQYIDGKRIRRDITSNDDGVMVVCPDISATRVMLCYCDVVSYWTILFSVVGAILLLLIYVLQIEA